MVDTLKKIVGEDSVLSDGKEKSRFDHIWKTDIPTNAKAVVFPKDTGELSSIMKVCFENNQTSQKCFFKNLFFDQSPELRNL